MNFDNFSCLTFRSQNSLIPPSPKIFHGEKCPNNSPKFIILQCSMEPFLSYETQKRLDNIGSCRVLLNDQKHLTILDSIY